MKNRTNLVGLLVIVFVIISLGVYRYVSTETNIIQDVAPRLVEAQEVTGYLGWEKKGLFQDEEVMQVLRNNGYIMNIQKKGSIEMVSESAGSVDYLFPSSKIALAIYESRQNKPVKSDTILYSPIVVYSWRSLLPELMQANLVKKQDNVYTIDLNRLVNLVMQGKTWQDINADSLRGRIRISSTDPTKSNSGNMFSALVANIFADTNDIITPELLTDKVLNKIDTFFSKMGLLDSSSGDMFAKFLALGRSTYPFVVGYESQLVEVINEGKLDVSDIVTLYPEQGTVWSEHEFIPLTSAAEGLSRVLIENDRIKQIAWESYGFRNRTVQLDTSLYQEYNIAKEITYAIPVPEPKVMIAIVEKLREN